MEVFKIETSKELVQIINKLEVIYDTIEGIIELYNKMEEHFNEPVDSNKLKLFILNVNTTLGEIINEFLAFINK